MNNWKEFSSHPTDQISKFLGQVCFKHLRGIVWEVSRLISGLMMD